MFEKTPLSQYSPRVKAGFLKLLRRKICHILARFAYPNGTRISLLKIMGINIGEKVYVGFDCFFDSDYAELITIEDNVMVSFRVIIVAHDGSSGTVSKIHIKRGAFLGAGAIILPGVTIGENAVVGAGSVIARDVPDGSVFMGNPATEHTKKK
ncbi:MAG TPA: acyltransferase [Alphaproteobacteria bacterium]|nr:acyltransferase [Alphaproteobacteria bacterium]